MKPRVLQLINSFYPAGSERQTVQLTRLLKESSRYQVHLASMWPEGLLLREIEELGLGEIPAYRHKSFYDINAARQLARFVRYLRRNRIEIIHTHDFYTNYFGMIAAWIARVPVRIASRRETTGFRTPMQERAEKIIQRMAHAVVVNAEAVRSQLVKGGVPPAKVITVYNGLDLGRVAPQFGRRETLEMFNLPRQDELRYITIVANMSHPIKDHPMFLRAARRVRSAVPEARFIMIGDGELSGQLQAMIAELELSKDVFMLGLCDRVAEVLAISDVCVLSSKSEGFSNVVLEYMAASRPAVVTDVGGAREAITDGQTGYLVESGDDQSMAERIIELLRDPALARDLGVRARKVVEEKFSCEARLEQTERLYHKLLSRTRTYLPGINQTMPQEDAEWLSK